MKGIFSSYQKLLLLVSIIVSFSATAYAINQDGTQAKSKPFSYAPHNLAAKGERLTIDYAGWDMVLRQTVWKKGFSNRKYAAKPDKPVGSLISKANPNPTRFEANRVFFHMIKDDSKAYIRDIRKSMETIPDELPLDQFSDDEQLAYWLNLRNVTVYQEIMDRYPVRKLKSFIAKLSDDKRLTVAGKAMSIRDIEELVIKKWQNPLVIYGFYMGAIGGPNLRKGAFTGDRVWKELADNAREFTYSLRGLQFDGDRARVSSFYSRVKSAFPDFENDLKTHFMRVGHSGDGAMLHYASLLAMKVKASPSLGASISDWYIADFINGDYRVDQSNPAAFVLSSMSNEGAGSGYHQMMMDQGAFSQYPPHARQLLQEFLVRNKKFRKGSVIVEDVSEAESPE